MKIPKKLKIGGFTFQVKMVDPNKDTMDSYGICDITNSIIHISTSIPKALQESTLIHEIIEAINGICEIRLEHTQITALEAGLYQVLKDNKLLK